MDEWELDIIEGGVFRNTDDGLEFMDLDEAQRRINAVERLDLKHAKQICVHVAGPTVVGKITNMYKAIRAYIDILEGK